MLRTQAEVLHPGGCDSVLVVSLFRCVGCSSRERSLHNWHLARFDGTLKSQRLVVWLRAPLFSRAVSFLRWNIKLCITTLLVVAEPRVTPGRLGLMSLWQRRKSTVHVLTDERVSAAWLAYVALSLCSPTETQRSGNHQSWNVDSQSRC